MRGEVVLELAPLVEAEGMELLTDRAERVVPFRASAEVVRAMVSRLDGIPLCLERAAARLSLLTPEQLRDRLDAALDLLATDRGAPEPWSRRACSTRRTRPPGLPAGPTSRLGAE